MTIWDGGRETWEASDPEKTTGARVIRAIAIALAAVALCAVLAGCSPCRTIAALDRCVMTNDGSL